LILHSCASTSAARPLFNGRDLTGWLGDSNTWRAENSLLITTGNPYGFIRTTRPYTNFILDLDWQHQPRPDTLPGNSGLFIWADSIASPASTQFPKSVEVQILVGLEWRDKSTNALTATSHGDIFPIWGATCKPDRPHPRGWQRSIPTEFRAKSFGHWNHYRVTAIDGTITLAVNGKAVSKVTDCQPRTGYIALEAEGNTVHFRNIRIQELP
jgi:hypothetical protein